MGWAVRAREGEGRGGFGGLGQIARLARFFETKPFSIFLLAKQIKQNQTNSKIYQANFVEFRNLNPTTTNTQTNKLTKIIFVK